MALALEIAFAAAIGIVALSFLAVVTGRASDRLLLGVTIALAVGAAIGVIALAIDLVAWRARRANGGRPGRPPRRRRSGADDP